MKRKYIAFVLEVFLLAGTGCKDEVEYRIDGNLPVEKYAPLDGMTVQMNAEALGHVVCDEEYTYFMFYEEGFGRVYKKHRISGDLTLVMERPVPEDGDLIFTYFHLRGEYLYFMLYEIGNAAAPEGELCDALCRVRTDGSEPFEVLYDSEKKVFSVYCEGDYAYINEEGYGIGFTLVRCNLETGKTVELFSKEVGSDASGLYSCSFEFILGDYVYYSKFENGRTLYRCRLDGTGDELVLKVPTDMVEMLVADERIYIADCDKYKLYTAGLDGSDLRLELENVRIKLMNVYDGVLYLHLGQTADYVTGLYEYRTGYKMPLPLYKGGDLEWGPIIDSYGDIWFTLRSEESFYGQLHRLDRRTHTWVVVK